MFVDYQSRRNEPLDVYKKSEVFYPNYPAAWAIADPDTCFSIFDDRLLFVGITDGYLRSKRYQVVELSLGQKKYRRLVKNARTVSSPQYSADGKTIAVTVNGIPRQLAAPFR